MISCEEPRINVVSLIFFLSRRFKSFYLNSFFVFSLIKASDFCRLGRIAFLLLSLISSMMK